MLSEYCFVNTARSTGCLLSHTTHFLFFFLFGEQAEAGVDPLPDCFDYVSGND